MSVDETESGNWVEEMENGSRDQTADGVEKRKYEKKSILPRRFKTFTAKETDEHIVCLKQKRLYISKKVAAAAGIQNSKYVVLGYDKGTTQIGIAFYDERPKTQGVIRISSFKSSIGSEIPRSDKERYLYYIRLEDLVAEFNIEFMRGSLFLRFEKLAENLFAVDISDPVKILTRQPKEIAAANAAVKKAYLDAKLDRLQQKKEKLEKREKLSPKVDDNAGETASKSAPADS